MREIQPEDAIIALAEALGINETQLVEILQDGISLSGQESDKITKVMNEMEAEFCY